MTARLIGTAFILISLPVRIAQAAGLPANSPAPGAHAEQTASTANETKARSQSVVARGVQTSDAKPSPRTDPQTQRARELIYFFRTHRVFCRDEEWAQTIRELATIGKPAVPELVAELDRTDRDATLRSLAFSMRAIGDPRAVPALIRSIPKALRPPGSDCGINIADPDLRAFMLAHQNYKNDRATHVACGRPVNEIISALERITKHREPPDVGDRDPLRHVFLGGTPEQQAQQRALFEQRQKLWQGWWSEHWHEFVTREELQSVELPKRDSDLVELAGVARYGALFPTGAGAKLGPVRMLRLTRAIYANGRSQLDLDTGRAFALYEGMTAADWGPRADQGSRLTAWNRRNGIDVYCQGFVEGWDLYLWLVDDARWDTLDAEIQRDQPLQLGREATSSLVRFEKTWTDFKYDKLATFLFTTRDGGRGIIQVFPRDPDADRYRLRYRMWEQAEAKPPAKPPVPESVAEPRQAKPPGTPFAKLVTTTLELPGKGREFLMDLDAGRRAVAPEFLRPDEFADTSALRGNKRFAQWCRDQGIDLFSYLPEERPRMVGAKAASSQPDSTIIIGLDMIAGRILPETFNELTAEDAREILERQPDYKPRTAWMAVAEDLAERPDTYVFRTREGTVGVLQMEAADKEAGKLKIRYRLERRN